MAERRQLTLLFCDLCHSTALSDRLDPEAMREVLDHYRRRCASALARYDGTVAYYMGDGILAYFGYPTAHEDDPARAVRAALEIVPAIIGLGRDWQPALPLPLQVRIAVHTGLVVAGEIGIDSRRSELWAVGKAPNIAARLQLLAAPDTIVISDATLKLLQGAFNVTSLGRHELAGIGDTIEAFRVESEQPEWRSSALESGTESYPLVNREVEFTFLEQCWELVQQGEGKAILVSGEAGIGKSRLIRALVSALRASEQQVVLLQCSPYFVDSPLHPVIDHFERTAGIGNLDSDASKLERLERLVGSLREDLPELVEVLADVIGLEQSRYTALRSLAPAERRARILATLSDYLLSLAGHRPVILICEDLHWADPTTREWLGTLFARANGAQLLGLVSLRPDFQSPWPDNANVAHLALDRLDREHSGEILDRLTRDSPLSPALRQRILGATDGVPLFVEELTKALLEAQDDRARSAPQDDRAAAVTIPSTLQDSLTARLDRLGEAKLVAQTAAVIGREFTQDLLAAVWSGPVADLDSALGRLVASGLVLALDDSGERFAFKHALVRDAAYDGLLHSARRDLHARIVVALETQFAATAAGSPELVAQHAAEALQFDKASQYWLRAGQLAVARSAHLEAANQLEHGLQVLRELPDTAATAARRLQCLVALGPSLILIEGPGSPRAEALYTEAVQLCERVEPSLDHVAAFWGWWRIAQGYDVVQRRSERLLGLASRLEAPAVMLQAHHCMWATRFEMADFAGTLHHIELGLELYEQGQYSGLADTFGGHDAKVCACGNAALALWHMGQPERALRQSLSALEWAERLGHAGTMLHALDTSVVFRRFRREWRAAGELAARMIDLAQQRGLRDHVAKGELYLGWSIASDGQSDRGIAMMRKAFATERESGTPEDFPIYADMIAEALMASGRADQAIELLDVAIAESEDVARLIWLPELYRRRGEATLMASASAADRAEGDFVRALEMARRQRSLPLELRAARSLAMFWWRKGRNDDARALLTAAFAAFAEGFETPDLRDAAHDLDSLQVHGIRVRTQA